MIDLLTINDPGGGFPKSYYASTVDIGDQLLLMDSSREAKALDRR